MANCKICNKTIPDGTEYCKDCMDEVKSQEASYQDSLLDEDDDLLQYGLSGMNDFVQNRSNDDFEDLNDEDVIGYDKLFGEDLSETFSDTVTSVRKQNSDMANESPQAAETEDIKAEKQEQNQEAADAYHNERDAQQETISEFDKSNDMEELDSESSIMNLNSVEKDDEDLGTESDKNFKEQEQEHFTSDIDDSNQGVEKVTEDEEFSTDFDDLLSQLEDLQDNTNAQDNTEEKQSIHEEEVDGAEQAAVEPANIDSTESEEDDILSLLNQISGDDPVADDVKVINDLMNDVMPEEVPNIDMPGDVGEVFSDALKAVSSLNDPNIDESGILDQIPDKKSKKKEKKKKGKKKNNTKADDQEGKKEEKPKVGLLKRIFGNVEDKAASKNSAKVKKPVDGEGAEAFDQGSIAQPKKAKKAKKAKASADNDAENGSAGKKPKVKKAKKKKEKKDKKAVKQKSNDAIQAIDELDEDLGRINRLGATIVFVFFVLIAILIYAGSNAVSYTLGIQHATAYFNEKEYTQAYEEVDGMKIKAEDIAIYRKILTVMFVNKQLNSYNNYCTLEEYPQALDSLLKGLERYNTYIELATLLGVKTDMDYIKNQILAELEHQFNLSEKDAFNIINTDNKQEYSLKVYEVALRND